jgi:hypothetical protein
MCTSIGRTFTHSSWVATRRGLTKPVSSSPLFKTRLAAFTVSGFTPSVLFRGQQHHEAFLRISPAPQESTRGQLARALGPFAPVFPKPRGLRLQSSSWCAQLSWAPTPLPHPTPVRTLGVSLGSRLPTLYFPWHSSKVSCVHNRGLKQNDVGGVLLNAPSPLWGSPVFLQGRVRLIWSPMSYHPMK